MTGPATPSNERINIGFRRCLCSAFLFMSLSSVFQAQDRQMQMSTNRTLVLTSYELVDPVGGTSNTSLYSVVFQKNPFIEIRLSSPLAKSSINKHRLRIFCEEIGVFKDERSRQTWTIGKGCRPL